MYLHLGLLTTLDNGHRFASVDAILADGVSIQVSNRFHLKHFDINLHQLVRVLARLVANNGHRFAGMDAVLLD